MGFGILGNGGIYNIYRAAVIKRQVGIGSVIDSVVPVCEEHYALTAGHSEKGRGKLPAVFEVGIKARVLTDPLYKGAELFFHIAVKVEEVGTPEIGKIFYILIICIGVKQAAACVRKAADGEAVLDGG